MLFNLFKSSFDKTFYLTEMNFLIDKAFERITKEFPDYKIYTISIWTDPNTAISSINFDSRLNSIKSVEKANQGNKKYYDEHIANKDFEQAELFKPLNGTRLCNPADFEFKDFEEFKHKSIKDNWEEISSGKCWTNKGLALCRRTSTQSSTLVHVATVVPSLTECFSSEFCKHQLINFTNQQFQAGRFSNSATSPSPERCVQAKMTHCLVLK
jgi:hypothetical protein